MALSRQRPWPPQPLGCPPPPHTTCKCEEFQIGRQAEGAHLRAKKALKPATILSLPRTRLSPS
eukprot:2952006-Prymnesium_polylepis.2